VGECHAFGTGHAGQHAGAPHTVHLARLGRAAVVVGALAGVVPGAGAGPGGGWGFGHRVAASHAVDEAPQLRHQRQPLADALRLGPFAPVQQALQLVPAQLGQFAQGLGQCHHLFPALALQLPALSEGFGLASDGRRPGLVRGAVGQAVEVPQQALQHLLGHGGVVVGEVGEGELAQHRAQGLGGVGVAPVELGRGQLATLQGGAPPGQFGQAAFGGPAAADHGPAPQR